MKHITVSGLRLALKLGGCTLALLATPTAMQAQQYLGANEVLRQVQERKNKPAEKPAILDENAQLRHDLQAFDQSVTNLAPADAARRWLELVDRAFKIQRSRQNASPSTVPIESGDVLGALPPPETWNELARAIAVRPGAKKGEEVRALGFRLLAATLTDDTNAQKQVIADLQSLAKADSGPATYVLANLLNEISEILIKSSDDPDITLKVLEKRIADADGQNPQTIQLPNLVSQVGKEKTVAFLRKALVTANVTLEFPQANDTSKLAQSLALEMVDQLKAPQWALVNSLDAVGLYEALDKRFGRETNTESSVPGLPGLTTPRAGDYRDQMQKQTARLYYFLGLVSQGRSKDAVVEAKKLGDLQHYYLERAFKAMERAGFTTALDSFFYELLSQDPTLPFWESYVELAAKAGRTDRMLTLVQAKLAAEDLSDDKKASLRTILFKAELAADKVDEGVAELRHLMSQDANSEAGNRRDNPGELAVTLAHIGFLMNQPDWTEEGISAGKKWLAAQDTARDGRVDADLIYQSLAQILVDLKRGPEAEALLTDAFARSARKMKKSGDYEWYNDRSNPDLAALAALYVQAGRTADVLVLLQQSPDWGVTDLAELFAKSSLKETDSLWLPVPCSAARALLADGQRDRARSLIYEMLNRWPGLDRGYELLLKLDGTNAIPKLDALFALDQFEERPLIWKGHLLREQGRLEEAEKVIRQAVAIDPSDGEEGRGDRMRVYSELAAIREARGDQKDADFYREVVKAIRMSEDADQYYQAGLLKRAVAMYETALSHFSDAYCIQSRLAVQLSSLGFTAEAEEHYRRAYELMPDSFGRVESHCFGCEGVFEGERAQGIAEKVFAKLAEEHPDKPQIHYLLGYLRSEQERFSEARTNYLEAVRLDPQYLNAWLKLREVGENLLVAPKERDETTFSILRLDPLRRHTRDDFSGVHDLPGLWHAVAAADSLRPGPVTNLLTLPASKLLLEKKSESADQDSLRMQTMERGFMSQDSLSPAAAVAENSYVQLAGQMFLSEAYGLDE